MKKEAKKRKLGWKWRLLLITILLLLLALAWLGWQYHDLTLAVARYKAETDGTINTMHHTIQSLQTANTGLKTDNEALHNVVRELTVKINGIEVPDTPKMATVDTIRSEVAPTLKLPAPNATTTAITVLLGAYTFIRTMLPALP